MSCAYTSYHMTRVSVFSYIYSRLINAFAATTVVLKDSPIRLCLGFPKTPVYPPSPFPSMILKPKLFSASRIHDMDSMFRKLYY